METSTSDQISQRVIKSLLTSTNELIISEIEEVTSEIGEPDCKLVNPCVIGSDSLTPWLNEVTNQTTLMISSDKIITLVDPNPQLLSKYTHMYP